MSTTNYAGFWLRFVAFVIDAIILKAISWIVLAPILAAIGITAASGLPFSDMDFDEMDMVALAAAISAMFGIAYFIGLVVDILYHSLMESSKFQGSLGKMALRIIVTDTNGAKLDFGKALLRNVCKILSGFALCIGYIIAGFTEKKQALHDIIASTLVVKK